MADYRRYQPRYSSGGVHWRRWFLVGIVLVVVVLIGRGILGGGRTTNDNSGDSEISLVNEGADGNTNIAVPSDEANNNTNAGTNTNRSNEPAGTEIFSDEFSLDICPTPISSYGDGKFIALTFDLSAANADAQKVLDSLKDKNARASFFVRGTFAEKNKDFVATVAKAGFGVYSGSYETKNLSALSNEEVANQVTRAETAIAAATGESPKPLLRPPSGDYDNDVLTAARAAGYCLVLWTVDAFDWQDGISAAESIQRVMDKAAPGAIVALHAGYDVTAAMLPSLIDKLRSAGYTLVSVPTLLQQ